MDLVWVLNVMQWQPTFSTLFSSWISKNNKLWHAKTDEHSKNSNNNQKLTTEKAKLYGLIKYLRTCKSILQTKLGMFLVSEIIQINFVKCWMLIMKQKQRFSGFYEVVVNPKPNTTVGQTLNNNKTPWFIRNVTNSMQWCPYGGIMRHMAAILPKTQTRRFLCERVR